MSVFPVWTFRSIVVCLMTKIWRRFFPLPTGCQIWNRDTLQTKVWMVFILTRQPDTSQAHPTQFISPLNISQQARTPTLLSTYHTSRSDANTDTFFTAHSKFSMVVAVCISSRGRRRLFGLPVFDGLWERQAAPRQRVRLWRRPEGLHRPGLDALPRKRAGRLRRDDGGRGLQVREPERHLHLRLR